MRFPHHHHSGHCHASEHSDHHGRPCVRPDFPFGGGAGGGKRERIFASGDLKFVVLHLLAQKPAHGYDLIRALSELVGGDYSPSPGTIYPTLAMLEDLGFVAATPDGNGRKEYAITAEGKRQLDAQQASVDRVLTHINQHKSRSHARRIPEILRAMENLKTALRIRLGDDIPEQALSRRISEIIDRAAVDIERIE
jgi:DNA-binding PadR family transcriptional regulator